MVQWIKVLASKNDNVSLILVPHKEKKDNSSKLSSDLHVDVIEYMHSPIASYHIYTQSKCIDKCHYLHLSIEKTIFFFSYVNKYIHIYDYIYNIFSTLLIYSYIDVGNYDCEPKLLEGSCFCRDQLTY